MSATLQRRRGIHFGWLFLAAAVLGIAVGTALAKREQLKDEQALDEAMKRAEAILPQGQATDPGMFVPGKQPGDDAPDPFAPDPRALAGIPPYPGAVPRALISGSPRVQDVIMAVAWFETDDSPNTVVSFYEQAFAQAQLVYVAHRESERLGYAAYVNPTKDGRITRAVVHMVTAVTQGSKTLVLISASSPGLMLENQANLPLGVDFPPGTTGKQVVDLTEFGQARQTAFGRVENRSAQDLVEWYGKHFAALGWELVEKNLDNSEQFSMTARGGAASQVVMLRPGQGGVDVVISYENRARGAPTGVNQ